MDTFSDETNPTAPTKGEKRYKIVVIGPFASTLKEAEIALWEDTKRKIELCKQLVPRITQDPRWILYPLEGHPEHAFSAETNLSTRIV